MLQRISWAFLALLLAGCEDSARLQVPVARFRTAANTVIYSSKSYYSGLNKAERDHYIDQHVAEKRGIDPSELTSVQVFDSAGLESRMKTLDIVGKFAELMSQLAGPSGPAGVSETVVGLQKSVGDLSVEIGRLSGDGNAGLQAATGKALPLLGSALQRFVNYRSGKALADALPQAVEPINSIIKAIETDMVVTNERQRGFLSARRLYAVQRYRADLESHASAEILRRDGDVVSLAEDHWEASRTLRPEDGLKALRQALETVARLTQERKRSSRNASDIAIAIESFAQRTQQLADAAGTIRSK